MTAGPAFSASRFPIALFLFGVALRLPGLLFNGMADVYQILLEWGAAVHHLGLVEAFGVNYGILSYVAFGATSASSEMHAPESNAMTSSLYGAHQNRGIHSAAASAAPKAAYDRMP